MSTKPPKDHLDGPRTGSPPHRHSPRQPRPSHVLKGHSSIAQGSSRSGYPGCRPSDTPRKPEGLRFTDPRHTTRDRRVRHALPCGSPGLTTPRGLPQHPKRRTAPYSRFRSAVRDRRRDHRPRPHPAWEDGGSAVLQVDSPLQAAGRQTPPSLRGSVNQIGG
jgi:hypothetical protein